MAEAGRGSAGPERALEVRGRPGEGADRGSDDRPPETPASAPRFLIQNRQRGFPVDGPGLAAFLHRAAEEVAPGDPRIATLRLVSDRTMRGLNRRYRRQDRATDVLAFPAGPAPGEVPPYLGDLVVSVETAARESQVGGRALDRELRTLALHGLLHLFGYDHERDRGEMNRLERLLRRRHGLAASGGDP